MIDYSLPVARRTRARVDQAYKEYFEIKKKEKKNGVGDSAESKLGSNKLSDGSKKMGSRCTMEYTESVVVSDDSEEASEEVIGVGSLGEGDGDSVDSCPVESAGSKTGKKSELGFGKIENVGSIDVDDSDDDVVFVGEKGGVGGGGDFGCLNFQKSGEVAGEAREDASEDASENGSEDASEDVSDDDNSDEKETLSSEESSFSDDEDFEPENSRSFGFLEQLNSWGGDAELKKGENNDESEVRKGSEEVGEEQSVEVGAKRKRKRKLGLDITQNDIGSNKDDYVNYGQKFNCVAQRTRSRRSNSIFGKKITGLGTLSQPISVDEDDLGSTSWYDDDIDEVDETCSSGQRPMCNLKKSRSDDMINDDNDETCHGSPKIGSYKWKTKSDKWNDVQRVCKNNERNLGKFTKRKCTRTTKDCDAFQILVDSIYAKREVTLEGLASFGDESSRDERNPPVAKKTILPLKFDFNLEQSSVLEKSDFDRELDKIWAQCDFALSSIEIGSSDSNVVENNKDSLPPVNEADTVSGCSQGHHEYILNEEIGIICRFCLIVKQEIKYMMPSFSKYPFGKSGTRGFQTEDRSIFDELRCHDFDSHSGSDSDVHAEGTVWDFIPGVRGSMYPHQREGFEFIWNHIAGGMLKKTSSADGGNGCIISHAPGTGKTRLTIVFLQTYMELNRQSRPLIIAPRSMLLTWGEELKKWKFGIPFYNLNDSELSEEVDEVAINLVKQSKSQFRVCDKRMLKLFSWKKKAGILGISYRLFEKLCGVHRNKENNKTSGAAKEDEQIRNILLEIPDVVVFDEGHTPRNHQSRMWKAISKIKTKRRILLSGTPFQNNFLELFNTVRLVRPEFEDSIYGREFFKKRRGPKSYAEKRQRALLINCNGKVVDDNTKLATEFRAKIAPFVHTYRGSILQDSLPGLRKCLVTLQPTQLQESFIKRIQGIKEPFRYEHLEAAISVHPSLLLNEDTFSGDWDNLKKVQLNPGAGVKAIFVMELVRLSIALNERVLVFSQYVGPLAFTMDLLKSQFKWTEGQEVLFMDGKCDTKQRQSSMKVFNDPFSKAKVLLASTKACNEGINLVGASRVVFLDVTWNPSVERQAISRAYRLGQKNLVFIYHLFMDGTKEEEKYRRQAEKHRLSELVFSCSDRDGDGKKISETVSDDEVLGIMVSHKKLEHIFQRITFLHEDKLKA